MSTKDKDLVIISTLTELTKSLHSLTSQVQRMDAFLHQNFRNYNSSYTGIYSHIDKLQHDIHMLKEFTLTNKDHAHRLEQVGVDENGNLRRSEPLGWEYPMDAVDF